jgi:hypothetical protein
MRNESDAVEFEATSHPLRVTFVEPETVIPPDAVGDSARTQAFACATIDVTARVVTVTGWLENTDENILG